MPSEKAELAIKTVERLHELETLVGVVATTLPAKRFVVRVKRNVGRNKEARALAQLRENPQIQRGDLAARVYGADHERNRNRIRSLLWTLKKKGRIRITDQGVEVVND